MFRSSYLCGHMEQGGRKRCSTVAPLRGTKAKREAKRRRKIRGREENWGEKEERRMQNGPWKKETSLLFEIEWLLYLFKI